jgi:F-type H+-transporting ATPase subunit epsilon
MLQGTAFMTTFTFELVSPERQLFSGAVDQVVVPGSEGDFGVLANHAPFVSSIRPGILTIHGEGQPRRLYAETATPLEELRVDQIDAEIKDALEDLADAKDDRGRSKAAEKLDQLNSVKSVLTSSRATH